MLDLYALDAETLSTVSDSLRDAEEGHEAAFYASGNALAREMADGYALLADKVDARMPVRYADRDLILSALRSSMENCNDLGLDDAGLEYQEAYTLVESLDDLDRCVDGCSC